MLKKLEKEDLIVFGQIENTWKEVYPPHSIEMDYAQNPFTNYVCVEIDHVVVGVMNYNLIYDRIELNQINVVPSFQNQKIASSLLEYLIREAMTKKVKNITLEVKETNQIAIHLYHKYGFREVAKRMNYYQGIDGILMEKEMRK